MANQPQIWELNPIDLKLKLLYGLPLTADRFEIEPVTLGEIAKIGYTNYMKMLNVLTVKTDDLIKPNGDLTKEIIDKITPLEAILLTQDADLITLMMDGLKFFLKEDKYYFNEHFGIIFGVDMDYVPKSFDEVTKMVNRDNYRTVVEVIKHQNCMANAETDLFNPKDEKTRKIIEKIKKSREIIKKAKANKQRHETDEGIDFYDIISSVSTKSNTYNKHNIWDCTIYQIYDEFKRLEAISGYETSVMAMCNGAKIDDLKHWSAKLDNNDD